MNIAITDDLPEEPEEVGTDLGQLSYGQDAGRQPKRGDAMNRERFLIELFCHCVYFPAGLMFYLPMRNQLKYGAKKTLVC